MRKSILLCSGLTYCWLPGFELLQMKYLLSLKKHRDTQHNEKISITLKNVTFSITILSKKALNTCILTAFMVSVVNDECYLCRVSQDGSIMLLVVRLNVIIINAVMLNVVVPLINITGYLLEVVLKVIKGGLASRN